MTDALVIGAGPAGLMAAQALLAAGRKVTLVEAKPSIGRKFLMAGKSGLNLTKDEPIEQFIAAYGQAAPWLAPMIAEFDPRAVKDWAQGLGQDVFSGSTGQIFPKAMKASPLLRAWVQSLDLELRTGWRWAGWENEALAFDTPDGRVTETPRVTVLALGGASWARLGSDAAWAPWLLEQGVELAPFKPANMGFQMNWSAHMTPFFGAPVKGCALHVADQVHRGEFVISKRGLEGGGIYAVSRAMREGAALTLDLLPDLTLEQVTERLARPRGKLSISSYLRKTLRLDGARMALVNEFARPLPQGPALAQTLKALEVHHAGPRPIDEAISTAGGVTQAAMNDGLMLTARPGVFCAGEMLDWEAPTGGYLLTACFATGLWAGRHAAEWAA
ncbi:MAG: putative flavoprotein (TIGR03862 family) [Paracoccaceae bacterium]|jgi:uncharacterized flavoprotein (TIGR03862 family)